MRWLQASLKATWRCPRGRKAYGQRYQEQPSLPRALLNALAVWHIEETSVRQLCTGCHHASSSHQLPGILSAHRIPRDTSALKPSRCLPPAVSQWTRTPSFQHRLHKHQRSREAAVVTLAALFSVTRTATTRALRPLPNHHRRSEGRQPTSTPTFSRRARRHTHQRSTEPMMTITPPGGQLPP